ncbi:MAG: energy-coupling factor transporter transmembrane protein EcfT [Clostridia bacterium]|nr:energy-coupling factor transporter transmembrane protein EcfT [Clostridia bacterium]
MLKDITFGQYFPGQSLLHRLDPRTKILLSLIFIVILFVAKTPIAFLLMILLTAVFVEMSKIPFGTIFKGIRAVLILLLFTAAINLFLTKGQGTPLLEFWVIKIYAEGIWRAVIMAVRVVLLILISGLFLTYTTTPIALTDGIESLLSPLKKIRIPVHEFAMMITIALRFIPTLIEETDRVISAQKARGADFSSGGLIKRARALIPILVPLLVSSIKHAEDLATAMECRCYRGGDGRTRMVKLTYRTRDFLMLLFVLAIGASVFVLNHYIPILLPDLYYF